MELDMDPIELRKANFPQDSPISEYIDELTTWAEIDKRKQSILTFNKVSTDFLELLILLVSLGESMEEERFVCGTYDLLFWTLWSIFGLGLYTSW